MPVVGFLNARSPADAGHLAAAFRRGLAENGYVDSQTVTIEYRWALGQDDRLPVMAELVGRPVAVLAATGGENSALAAKAATSTIPIVFAIGAVIRSGSGSSQAITGRVENVTAIKILTNTLEAKRLGLLHELVPKAVTVGVLLNPNWASSANQLRDMQEAARVVGLQIDVFLGQ